MTDSKLHYCCHTYVYFSLIKSIVIYLVHNSEQVDAFCKSSFSHPRHFHLHITKHIAAADEDNSVFSSSAWNEKETFYFSRKRFFSNLVNRSAITGAAVIMTSTTTSQILPQAALATYIDPKTKINLPEIGEIENAIPSDWNDIENPLLEAYSNKKPSTSSSPLFNRLDNTNDSIFYSEPRFVEHVDDNAVNVMQEFITNQILKPNMDVLDLCSSWTSHISTQTKIDLSLSRVAGLGMNEEELKRNPVLSDYVVMNLNMKQQDNNGNGGIIRLPYDDTSFDVVLCQLSIDYLIYPLEIMKEVGRILKPGGQIVILFSNRLFLQKAVGLWTGADDVDHAFIVGSYVYFSGGGFAPLSIKAKDLSSRNKKGMIVGDPIYVVTATKNRI